MRLSFGDLEPGLASGQWAFAAHRRAARTWQWGQRASADELAPTSIDRIVEFETVRQQLQGPSRN